MRREINISIFGPASRNYVERQFTSTLLGGRGESALGDYSVVIHRSNPPQPIHMGQLQLQRAGGGWIFHINRLWHLFRHLTLGVNFCDGGGHVDLNCIL